MSPDISTPTALTTGGEVVSAAAITSTYPARSHPLRCPACGAAVRPVAGYLRANQTAVDPVFRLASGHHHLPGCLYAHEPDRSPSDAAPEGSGLNPPVTLYLPKLGDHSANPRAITTFLKAVATLTHRYADQPDLRDAIPVIHQGEPIEWSDWYFDATCDIKRLHGLLASGSDPINAHPIVVRGVIASVTQARTGSTFAARLRTRAPERAYQGAVRSQAGIPIVPVIRSRTARALTYRPGDTVLACGAWHLFGTRQQPTLWLGATGALYLRS